MGKHLSPDIFNPVHLAVLLGIGLLSGLVAGSYPAFYLSSFNPIGVLKGLRIKTGAGTIFIRKGLVVVQFAVSITFIICTLIIYQQVIHIKERDLGYNKDNLITMEVQGAMKERFATIRSELLSTGLVENAAMSLHSPLQIYSYGSSFDWPGKDPNATISIHSNDVSPEYLSTMHMKLLSGRDFYPDYKTDSANVIISNSLAKLMGAAGKIGGTLTSGSYTFNIVGIAGDVVYNDMYGPGAPIIFFCGMAATGDDGTL